MTVENSHGKPRPRVPRPGEHANVRSAVLAAPMHDRSTGRFLPGNQVARLRALKHTSLATLNPSTCAVWVRPFVELVHSEALALVAEAGAESSESLKGFATAAAEAHAMWRACMSIALADDVDDKTSESARSEARAWLKEHRQSLLSLRAEARAGLPERGDTHQDLDRALGIALNVSTTPKAGT